MQELDNNELMHYGVPGMKWGVRKAPVVSKTGHRKRKPGSLVDALNNLKKKRQSKKTQEVKKEETKPKTKSLSEMSDAELQAKLNRLNLERNIIQTQQQLSALQPQHVSRGKRFVKSAVDDVLMPAAREAGKKFLTDYLNAMGAETIKNNFKGPADELAKWERKSKIANYKKQILDYEKSKREFDNPDTEYDKLKKDSSLAALRKTIYDAEKARLEVESKTSGNNNQQNSKPNNQQNSKPNNNQQSKAAEQNAAKKTTVTSENTSAPNDSLWSTFLKEKDAYKARNEVYKKEKEEERKEIYKEEQEERRKEYQKWLDSQNK